MANIERELSFFAAQTILGKRDRRKLKNNTYLQRRGEDKISVLLYHTYVVTFYRDGKTELNSGGWETVITKERLNTYQSHYVYTMEGMWWVRGSDHNHYRFEDHMMISPEGIPNTQPMCAYQYELLTGEDCDTLEKCIEGIKRLPDDKIIHVIRFKNKYDELQDLIIEYRKEALARIVSSLNSDRIVRLIRQASSAMMREMINYCPSEHLPLLIRQVSEDCDLAIEHRLAASA